GEGRELGSFGHPARPHRVVESAKAHFESVRKTLGVTAGVVGEMPGRLAVEAGVLEENLVGLFATAAPDLVGFLAVDLDRALRPGDLVAETILPAWRDLGNE